MTEAISYTIGAVSLAALLGSFNAWLERSNTVPLRQRALLAVAKWCCVWCEGDRARIEAKQRATEKKVELT